ncbi:MAG: DUF4062 domain-containing protein [Prevotellaceae bacterium]|nr:DUF4062 domain-containing protein [Candidatus Colivivens equi]
MVWLIAIPVGKKEFMNYYHAFPQSDFMRSLRTHENSDSEDDLWVSYKKTSSLLSNCIRELRKRNVRIIKNFCLEDLKLIKDYDVTIFMAHHYDSSDAIEIGGSYVPTSSFIQNFPSDYSGVFDASSCYSSLFQTRLKLHCPSCRVLAVSSKTAVNLRLFLYSETVKQMVKDDEDYLAALNKVCVRLVDSVGVGNYDVRPDMVCLGNDLQSSVFAPKEVSKGDNIMVQLFLYKSQDEQDVMLTALMVDEKATVRNKKSICVKIKKGDYVVVSLEILNKASSDFDTDSDRKMMEWIGKPMSVEFLVRVSDSCVSNSFDGKIRLEVNFENVVDMLFRVNIVEKQNPQIQGADFRFEPHDRNDEIRMTSELVRQQLGNQICQLENQMDSDGEKNVERIKRDIEICKHCLSLLNNKTTANNPVLKVFISSTSDMKEYRDVVKRSVEGSNLYPEMYENWSQKDIYPRDMCCEKMMGTDMALFILGASYGYVEPIWNLSMTEIEFYVALQSGKEMLVYVDKNYQSKMNELNETDRRLANMQKQFIEAVSKYRIIRYFSDKFDLELQSHYELGILKAAIENKNKCN